MNGINIGKKCGYKYRYICLLCMIVFSLSIFLSSYSGNFYIFIILYGVIPGYIIGILYFIPIICAWTYFPDNKGFVIGIITSGLGFSSALLNIITTYSINPDN